MYAVLDLGSNSFHMVIAEKSNDRLNLLKTMSNKVQLADGLGQTGKISKNARERAFATLKAFRLELSKYPIEYFCVVGTSALREAKNAKQFIEEAKTLGFCINVISGTEEAFYIYQGVHAFLPSSETPRLIFDIGGGSTEFAIGNKELPLHLNSLPMGCVTLRTAKGDDDKDEKITHKLLAKTRRKAHEMLEHQLHSVFYTHDWHEAYATSGTAKMLSAVLRENKLTDGEITLQALWQLEDKLVSLGTTAALESLPGLKSNRRSVMVSGLAIMQSVLDHLGIDHVDYSDVALREGVLLSLDKQGKDFPLFTLIGAEHIKTQLAQ